MCLRVDKSKKGSNGLVFDKAEEDITCYKVLIKEKLPYEETETYYTPYMDMEVKLQRRYDDDRDLVLGTNYDDLVTVEDGVFHLFKNLDEAINEAYDWSKSIVVEAIIPKGAEYIDGTFYSAGFTSDSCGTKSVIYKKKVWPSD